MGYFCLWRWIGRLATTYSSKTKQCETTWWRNIYRWCSIYILSLSSTFQSAWKGVVQESCDHFGRSSNEEYNTVVCFDTIMSSVVSLSADVANWQQETEWEMRSGVLALAFGLFLISLVFLGSLLMILFGYVFSFYKYLY